MLRTFAAVVGIFSAIAHHATADSVPAVGINPGTDIAEGGGNFFGFDEPNSNGTWGWSFYVSEPMTVTHVGWYDESQDGLSHSHTVQIWRDISGTSSWPYIGASEAVIPNSSSTIGATGLDIRAGTVEELVGPWRRRELPSPVVLTPGGYAIGGNDRSTSTDAIRYALTMGNPLTPTITDPRMVIGAPGSGPFGSAPSFFILVDGLELGPMFWVTPVPEPSCIILVLSILGASNVCCLRRHRTV
jgi:hypothetical protein